MFDLMVGMKSKAHVIIKNNTGSQTQVPFLVVTVYSNATELTVTTHTRGVKAFVNFSNNCEITRPKTNHI
jgi:hypothetical protein